MKSAVKHNGERNRFEMEVEGKTAYIRYVEFKGGLDILTTRVPPELEGRGIASVLTKHALDYARDHKLKIIASCSFTAAYLRRHPEYQELTVE